MVTFQEVLPINCCTEHQFADVGSDYPITLLKVCLYHSNKNNNLIHMKISFAEAKNSAIDMKQRITPLWIGKFLSNKHFNSEGK